ncbi:MAG TPA: TonB-dependent receptor [Sphingobium sp.]
MTRVRLLATASVAPALLAILSNPAAAQSGTTAAADDSADDSVIVVTGSILRQPGLDTPSPLSVVSAETMEKRAIQTTQEAIQRIPSNNGPALTNSFTANGAFASGASAVSLRGLSTSSTLVLFDGQRAAYYPLSDDATRNFVDLNTIPDDVVDRVEVLRDGASSTYGADAIAGVVNIITKKQITGISGRVEAGITERGDGKNYRASLTMGTGDLKQDGYNVYLSGFYYRQDSLYNRDRPYPYNSADQSGICNNGVCGPQIGPNGGSLNPTSTGYEGFYTGSNRRLFSTTLFVAPQNTATGAIAGRYQLLNPAAGCVAGERAYTLSAANLAAFPNDPTTSCSGDLVNQYGLISPKIERFGGTFRATGMIGENVEAYFQANFLQSTVSASGEPATIRANAPAGINFPRFSTYTSGLPNAPGSFALALPVYVCPLVNGLPQAVCNAGNGTLNTTNNPFAAQGQSALLIGRIPNIIEYTETVSRTYRAAFGLSGPLFDKWDFRVEGVGMRTDLNYVQNGNIYIQHLLNVIADGSFNFANPYANSQAQLNYLAPANVNKTHSDLYSIQAIVTGKLFDLPGGPVQLGFGASARVESINAPSANNDINGPTERYQVINAFGTKGERTVYSGFFELSAPIIDQVEVNAGGRYDHYSSGQSAFSPKAGIRVEPIKGITLRGTWARGFRIPSFAEANAVPTTGFVNNTVDTFTDAYLAQYGCTAATFTTACPTYLRSSSYGQTTLASPNLQPEKSTSWTGGVIIEPIRNVTLTVDYYNIKKTGAITTPQVSQALAAYYGGQAIPSAFNIIADSPDPAFPNATPRIAYVQSQLINADTINSEGLDFGITTRFNLGPEIRWTSQLEATYIINLSTTFADGSTQSYEGTSGNNSLTAGSGTPEWHGNWVNSFEYKDLTVTASAEFFGGYDLSAEDVSGPGTAGQCGLLSPKYVKCRVADYITVDLAGSYKINDKFTLYVNVINVFDNLPPIDPITYGANNYNAVQGGTGMYGRSYRAGVKASF